MKHLFIGYCGLYDDDMTPVAVASEHDQCLSNTLHALAQLGLLRSSQISVQDKGEVSDDEFSHVENAFTKAMKKMMAKNINHEAKP